MRNLRDILLYGDNVMQVFHICISVLLIFLLLEESSFHTTAYNILFLAPPFLTYALVKMKTKRRQIKVIKEITEVII